jgi:hypothetical protein
MALIKASAHFCVSRAERQDSIELKVVYPLKATPASRGQRGGCLGSDAPLCRTEKLS